MNTLQTGRYTVTNVRFLNLAVLPSSRIGSDIVAQCDEIDVHTPGEMVWAALFHALKTVTQRPQWDITRLHSGRYTIANRDHFSFVGLSRPPQKGDNVSAGYGQEWTIRSTGVNAQYVCDSDSFPRNSASLNVGVASAQLAQTGTGASKTAK